MGHIILDGPGGTVQKGSEFSVNVRVQDAKPPSAKVKLEQFKPSGPELGTVDVVVLPDGTGSNYADVTIGTTGLVTIRGVDVAGKLSSDTLTLMVNP